MDNFDEFITERQDEIDYLADLFGGKDCWNDLSDEEMSEVFGHKVA